jgi:[protein-PII] uridylyltransferase
MSQLRPHVLAARRRLAEGHEELRRRHHEGSSGCGLCALASDIRDHVILGLFSAALSQSGLTSDEALRGQIALVPHGGYGRRDVAPFSDVDLMVLYDPEAAEQVRPLATRLFRDVVDAGLVLGHSVRTPEEAWRLAAEDAQICTSLIESRFLFGSVTLFGRYMRRFHHLVGRRGARLVAAIEKERREERIKFGETVYLLEPNVKRSRGGLRDVQLVRWIAWCACGTPEPDELLKRKVLSQEDYEAIRDANEFLLWLRNEMHLHFGRPVDVLDRSEQVRVAQRLGYRAEAGMLAVELFMRNYFRHTDQVSQVVTRLATRARSARRMRRVLAGLLGHRVQGGFRVGPGQIMATRHGRRRLRGNVDAIMELVDLANLYDKPIDPETWQFVHQQAVELGGPITPRARRHFRSLLEHPARLGEMLRCLHQLRLLEWLIPEFAHARGLFEFNQYHKYTVDEHSFQAVDEAVELRLHPGPVGRVYRQLGRKHVLHLALLIHDLGKGYPEDHSELGRRIARRTAERLGLDGREAEELEFLVHRHLVMSHLAFRRDTSDEQLIVRFAVDVGSPERLGMLFVLTACDQAAVGPGAWNSWKAEVLTDLYQRTMQHLAGDSPAVNPQEHLERRREAVRASLGPTRHDPWFVRQVAELPATYLGGTAPEQIAADLRLLHGLPPDAVNTHGSYQPETETVQFTVATREEVTPGIFHKLTGALTGQGLEILSAEINTLADDLVLDRFEVRDPDYAGPPPPERMERVNRALVASLRASGGQPPTFRRTWQMGGHRQPAVPVAQNRVRTDNSTSATHTIFDIFAVDRPGLLYAVTRTLFEAGLSVSRARIATYLDQVVDVFYVTDQSGNKIEDEARLAQIRDRLLEVIGSAKDG